MVTNDTAGRARSLLAKRRRRLGAAAFALLVLTLLYASSFVVSWGSLLDSEDPLVRRDVARLTPARVERVDRARSVGQLRTIVREAGERGLKVSISGSRHSQGGRTYTEGGVVLDMRSFNRIVVIDTISSSITVESGATWDEVQRAIAPHGLAVKVMQSSNIFTVGGTLSANGHGRDLDQTQVVEVVDGFRLLLADGRVVNVSREENAELFSLVIGGYGLYGVILDVTLRVTRDELYEQPAISMDFTELPRYLGRAGQARRGCRPFLGAALHRSGPGLLPSGSRRGYVATGRDRADRHVGAHRRRARLAGQVLPRALQAVRLGKVAALGPPETGRARPGQRTRDVSKQRHASASGTPRAPGLPGKPRRRHHPGVLRARGSLRVVHEPLSRDPPERPDERPQLHRAVRERERDARARLRARRRRAGRRSHEQRRALRRRTGPGRGGHSPTRRRCHRRTAEPTTSPISCIRPPNSCIAHTRAPLMPSSASASTIPPRPSPASSGSVMDTRVPTEGFVRRFRPNDSGLSRCRGPRPE